MKKLITTLVILALLLGLVPAVVYAATSDVAAAGKGGNTAPTVTAVALVESGSDTAVTAMTPLTTYRVKVTAGDLNTIDDIQVIEFHIYYSSDGTNWDADALGIFKWTKAGNVWSMENGSATTTWEVVGASCISPSIYTTTSGDWYLAFKPGKLAQADAVANWHASAKAYDENKNGSGSGGSASMGAYAEISLDAASVTFGDATAGIEPGQTGYITVPATNYNNAKVTTNKQYALGVKSSATWSDGGSKTITLAGGTGVPAGSSQFNLTVDNELKGGGSPGEPKTLQGVTSTDATIAGLGNVSRIATNANTSESTGNTPMYMGLSFAVSGIQEVTYSGTITFTVTN